MTRSSLSPPLKTVGGSLVFLAASVAFLPATATAATVSGGALTLNLDRDKLAAAFSFDATPAPSMYLEEFFDAQAAAVRTSTQLLNDDLVPGTGEIPATGLGFSVNGTTAVNPADPYRHNQATTLSFDPTDLTGTATGAVGLGGATRFRVDTGTASNRVMFGDYSLEYSAANADAATGRSGWTLYNNLYYKAEAYPLFHVVTDLTGGSLDLAGDLGLGAGFDHLSPTPGAVVGSFHFQTAVVPVPAAVWLLVSGLAGLGIFGRRRDAKA